MQTPLASPEHPRQFDKHGKQLPFILAEYPSRQTVQNDEFVHDKQLSGHPS